ncbi:hypothetical protein ANTPLA_LOCUS5183 [Anthophora plagiata]
MDCKNNISDQLSSELLYNINKRIEDAESKLSECHKECECTELKIHEANQLKDKGTFVLKMVKGRYDNLNDELREIHFNYAKCSEKINSNKENVQQNINSLTMQRIHLRKELQELKKTADENKEKLMEVKRMITTQENKNMALMRKLKRMMKNMHITPDLKDRINVILNDPRLTNVQNYNQAPNQ